MSFLWRKGVFYSWRSNCGQMRSNLEFSPLNDVQDDSSVNSNADLEIDLRSFGVEKGQFYENRLFRYRFDQFSWLTARNDHLRLRLIYRKKILDLGSNYKFGVILGQIWNLTQRRQIVYQNEALSVTFLENLISRSFEVNRGQKLRKMAKSVWFSSKVYKLDGEMMLIP